MAGLVPAIHVFLVRSGNDVDTRHKAGHDEPILKRAVGFSDLSSRRTARHGVLVSGSDTSPALPMTLNWFSAKLASGNFQRRNFLDLLAEFLLRPMYIVPLLQ